MDRSGTWGFVGALLGAVVGGTFAIAAAFMAISAQDRAYSTDRRAEAYATALADQQAFVAKAAQLDLSQNGGATFAEADGRGQPWRDVEAQARASAERVRLLGSEDARILVTRCFDEVRRATEQLVLRFDEPDYSPDLDEYARCDSELEELLRAEIE
jgi:hypothetical protein